ncbi:MAG: hypothetical protein K1X28_00180 [Parachlamydiales bacterium]|nr:hypothetical protein [Parachlamydiales bacterium]
MSASPLTPLDRLRNPEQFNQLLTKAKFFLKCSAFEQKTDEYLKEFASKLIQVENLKKSNKTHRQAIDQIFSEEIRIQTQKVKDAISLILKFGAAESKK